MDTIFVKQVKEGGPAFEAGLCTGAFPLSASYYGASGEQISTGDFMSWCDVTNIPTAHSTKPPDDWFL